MRLLEKRKDFTSTVVMDSMTLLMIGSQLIDLELRENCKSRSVEGVLFHQKYPMIF